MEKNLSVVLIEDDFDDSELLIESFNKLHTSHVKAFNKPSRFFEFAELNDCRDICLMVVDMNLPEESGIEVIKKIKLNPQLISIPILVFTTTGTPQEIQYCKEHDIEMFKKPNNIDGWESFAFVMAAYCDPRLARKTL